MHSDSDPSRPGSCRTPTSAAAADDLNQLLKPSLAHMIEPWPAGAARIELLVEHVWEWPQRPRRRRGGLLRPAGRVAKAAGKRLFKVATRNHDFRVQSSEGVVDLAGRRYMLDHGSYAQLYAGGQQWDGRSGRLLATLSPEEEKRPTPLWLLDILAGLTAATDEGPRTCAAPRAATLPPPSI